MKKIIGIIFLIGLFFILVPDLALAQWDPDFIGYSSDLPDGSIYGIFRNLMEWLIIIVGFFAIIGFCIAGIIYFIAAGDEDQAKRAKRAMLYSIIGVVVALGGYVVIQAVDKMLNGYSDF